jgi:hypothetical protein
MEQIINTLSISLFFTISALLNTFFIALDKWEKIDRLQQRLFYIPTVIVYYEAY